MDLIVRTLPNHATRASILNTLNPDTTTRSNPSHTPIKRPKRDRARRDEWIRTSRCVGRLRVPVLELVCLGRGAVRAGRGFAVAGFCVLDGVGSCSFLCARGDAGEEREEEVGCEENAWREVD